MLTSSAGVSRVPYIGWKGDYSKLDVVDYIGLASDYEDRARQTPTGSDLPDHLASNIGACCHGCSWHQSVTAAAGNDPVGLLPFCAGFTWSQTAGRELAGSLARYSHVPPSVLQSLDAMLRSWGSYTA